MQLAHSENAVLLDRINDERLRAGLYYWLSKCPPAGLPGRQDIDPGDITPLLPWVNLVDVVREGAALRYRHRLEGTGLVSRFGRGSTGRWFEESYSEAHLASQLAYYDEAVLSGMPNHVAVETQVPGRGPLVYSRLIMPLARDHKTVDMLFLLFSFHTVAYRVPSCGLPIHR